MNMWNEKGEGNGETARAESENNSKREQEVCSSFHVTCTSTILNNPESNCISKHNRNAL